MLRGLWDLPGPGLELVSPALAGRFLTPAPPGNWACTQLFLVPYIFFVFCCWQRRLSRCKHCSTAAKGPRSQPVSLRASESPVDSEKPPPPHPDPPGPVAQVHLGWTASNHPSKHTGRYMPLYRANTHIGASLGEHSGLLLCAWQSPEPTSASGHVCTSSQSLMVLGEVGSLSREFPIHA